VSGAGDRAARRRPPGKRVRARDVLDNEILQ
jgi:hypothetical protein